VTWALQETWWILSTMLWVHTCVVLWLCNFHVVMCTTPAPFTSLHCPILFCLPMPLSSRWVCEVGHQHRCQILVWSDFQSTVLFGLAHAIVHAWLCNVRVWMLFCISCLPTLLHRVCILLYFEFYLLRHVFLGVKNLIGNFV
jgi:hypothetical protein